MIPKFSPMSIGLCLLAAALAQESLVVDIRNVTGRSVGTATFSEAHPRGVELTLEIRNLPPGKHAFHIHQKPQCDATEDFNTAGLQHDPTGELYGNAEHRAHSGPAAGDPRSTLDVAADGSGHMKVVFPGLTLGNDSRSVFANGGTAIVFHAAPGAPGPTRIACGVIRRPKQ